MFYIISSHLPAVPIIASDVKDLKEDTHIGSQGNGNRDVAIQAMWIVAGISWAFHGVVNNLRARLTKNGNERKKERKHDSGNNWSSVRSMPYYSLTLDALMQFVQF